MDNYALALFLHVVGALGLFVTLGLEWASLRLLGRAATAEQVREGTQVAAGVRWVGGAALVTLLVSGIYMAARAWAGVAWTTVALGALILLAVIAAVLTGPRMGAIRRAAVGETGTVSASLRRLLHDPLLWVSFQIRLGIALGIVFLMTVKPDLNGSLLTMGVATFLGLASVVPVLSRRRAKQVAA